MRSRSVQSPVCLTERLACVVDDYAPINFIGHWDDRGRATLTNDGRTVVLTFSERPYRPFLVGGPLDGMFLFEQLHFHWGPDDHAGSEHHLDGRAHSMEVHLVHYNGRYGGFDDARNKADGLAVVAFLLQADASHDWMPLQSIIRGLAHVRRPGTTTTVPSRCLAWLREQELSRHYYTYRGSLTTAPYCEGVTWLVYRTPISVSSRQTAAFRELQSARGPRASRIASNFRPVQSFVTDVDVTFVRNSVRSLRTKL